ncbi:Epoxide hydrolase [Cystobacter fuscus DSM 2262]|uniref:Epoxide hydrolase n=1 Tax=Cystobacter fuscus (strain ATCC 25194 / DSM 2262 / NBRC 100088 / M29) TaxID=1242864 RepID=S9Q2Q0_CYSF2|nr:epoxide hydrolase [Cystobacter fuscus]EPX55564.1 Epoxide hydrolase [Cystobacter fuscus DSM 2262]
MNDFQRPSSLPSRRQLLRMMAGASALAAVGGETIAEAAGSSPAPATPQLTPFRVSIPQAALNDLKRRLAATRWPERETVNDWSQGVPLAKAQALIAYWRDRYDWRKFEARLNAFPQFRTQIDGLGIHFLHVKSSHANALPIVLTHGWPGSIVEFLKVIGPLTEPTRHGGRAEDAFHVVIPSLPGFGFSDKPAETGWDVARIARAWGVLMQRLGYTKWVAQGGDWGSGVTHALGHLRPDGLVAAHVNWPLVFPEKLPEHPTPDEQAAIDAAGRFANEQYGYFKQQATRPQTIGYALADSPAGQALWIYEKFQAWTDNRGNPEDALSMDEMLDNITLYWLTDTAASSARIYWQNSQGKPSGFSAGRIELPMAATTFPRELYRAPRKWAEALWPHLLYWGEVDKGGHFAAFEQPAVFANELREAFRTVR